MKTKSIFVILILSMLFFGCLGIDLGGKPKPVDNGSTFPPVQQGNNTTAKNQTGVIIISQSNTSSLGNNTVPNNTVSKLPGIQYTESLDSILGIYFISVAGSEDQGESILIKKGDVDILVDAGPAKDAGKVIDFLKGKNVDDIEILVSTHSNPDNFNGLSAIVDKYDIEEFWWNGAFFDNADYSSLLSKITSKKIPTKTVAKGDAIKINGMTISVLNPAKQGGTFGTSGVDNDAVVLKLTDNKFCLLLTSDILFGAQAQLQNNADIKCALLQIPHHGLGVGTSQIDTFLLKVAPKTALIAGSSYDPTPDNKGTRFTLYEKLKLKNISYYATYVGGTIKITSDGNSYVISYG